MPLEYAVRIRLMSRQAEAYDTELRKFTEEQPLKDSEDSNEEIWAFPMSSWAYYHKLRQIEWIIQMGFELDIYQVDELAGMYWYVLISIVKRIMAEASQVPSACCQHSGPAPRANPNIRHAKFGTHLQAYCQAKDSVQTVVLISRLCHAGSICNPIFC